MSQKKLAELLIRVRTAARTKYPEPEPRFDPNQLLSGQWAEWQEREAEWTRRKELQELMAYRAIANFAEHIGENHAVGQGIYAETAVADLEDMAQHP